MKNHIKNLVIFVCICTVITLLLAITNFFTAPLIQKNQNAAANKALLEVMPEAKGFEAIDIGEFSLPSTVTEAYRETEGAGYVIKLVTAGYGTDMVIMCGITADGTVSGAVCLSSNETLGKEASYGANFANKDAAGVDTTDIISGATKTTEAYKNAVKDAINAAIILGGGSVDIRSEEEILNDNLNAALPDGENKFQKWFRTEQLDGIDAVYIAENQSGYVFVMGEQFIGVKPDGTVLAEGADAAFFANAVAAVVASQPQEVSLAAYPELLDTVVSIKKTASGNYILDTKGAGYGIKGGDEYHPASGEYIIVRVAISPDLKILDCITVSESETDGLGDACANPEFYGQFAGKTQADYTQIDAISGATLTTNGYTQAIERAFAAVSILNGGGR